ncbi:hypothetical protein Rhe02_57630 [Rhizocola hellebori]|uniref:DUF1684 domain-containing protein n=1 Tax=Rhizocola hellebori TaxID=1392758 RepID=A0A8J3QBT9_9ACTN|nr:DUF1684 domain-containing protein [Rhizocola hellebori]GIH07696.1 hypothetical protein Rhe02_57630 [Rhizocola hellebori]
MAESFADEWRAWHDKHEANRAHRHGFLAITGVHWLTVEPQLLPDAPGVWSSDGDRVTVHLDDGEELAVAGEIIRGEHRFEPIAERGGINAVWGEAVIEIARRGGFDIVRPRHPSHPLLTAYPGTPAYPADPRWAITGRYVRFDEPRPTTVGSVVDDLKHVYQAPGRIDFEIDGRQLSLTAFDGWTPGSLSVLFTDATSGVTTYAANRSLQVNAPESDGAVVLDFNRAVNLPCAYTEYATCPLPPAENHLPVAIEAGEQLPASAALNKSAR